MLNAQSLSTIGIVYVAMLTWTSCGDPKSALLKRPEDPVVDRAVSDLWTAEVSSQGTNGDWLLSRSYYLVGDAISKFTRGEDFSHAAIYDADKKTVIEAVGSGVREIDLEEFLHRNHHIALVRPNNMTPADRKAALERARSQLGKPFDNAGMLGFDDPQAFYCSELVSWASQTGARNKEQERVMTPANLLKYGTVVYWSGGRTNAQTMQLAMERKRTR
jgi:hypothetical protein